MILYYFTMQTDNLVEEKKNDLKKNTSEYNKLKFYDFFSV